MSIAILVVVPTTGGPLVIRSLKARRGLPASAAFADGDYRPLPWSGDYARLTAPGGPLAGLADGGPHELRLSGSFDAGRSWEVPVCLAHGLLARGHRLVADPGEADLVLWATGAVDLDLAILPADYALLDKIARSRALLDAAPGAALAALLPEGPERAQAARGLAALGRAQAPVILPAAVPTALDALEALRGAGPATEPGPAPGTTRHLPRHLPRRPARAAAAAAGIAALAALGAVYARAPDPRGPAAQGAEQGAEQGMVGAAPARADPPAPAKDSILVEELVAPARSSCRRVAFGADPPERRPVPVEAAGRLRPSRLAPDLCGLAFRPAGPGLRVEVGPELRAAALPPTTLADGARAYFLREDGRRNLVYAAQAVPEAGPPGDRPGPAFTHALTHALERR
ncbi:hypothetical protein Q8W71_09650 [Methylobacterium sp. NEAU 140]|uniref:hypothetical protein n=1 Tax=Methylobacterium sp. NEAU 140 TaxID=3064945 RepID=UPI002734BA11|nr:hypothetical protein [Methylobacterium sp. NEAU 140]MDP4022885.1 hypothetical protein [Methylobacterium sp. NEAU 140]